MRWWRVLVLAVLGLVAGPGCHSAPFVNTHVESVNAEYRQLEDYVYCLEDENARLERELAALQSGRPAGAGTPRERGGLLRSRPRIAPEGDLPDLVPPTIEPGVPSETPPRRPTPRPGNAPVETFDLQPPTIELPSTASRASHTQSQLAPAAMPADTKITTLYLNPIHTGSRNLDSRPGDDALAVVIEPRNAADEFVPMAGAVSIVVLDPSKAGDAARVARWNFAAAATGEKLRTSGAVRGIQLQMPWPGSPPTTERLHLFVRYEAADGSKLQTDREILLTPPGQLSQRWTPRSGIRESGVGDRESVAAATLSAIPPTAPSPVAPASATVPAPLTPPAWSPYR